MISSKKIFFGASGVILFLLLLLPVSFFINLKHIEKVSAQEDPNSTNCYLVNEGFNMIIGGYNLPVFTENTKDKFFPGYPVYRYFFPSCPALNTSGRPTLYDFDKGGALTLADNLVIGGDKTFLLTNDNTVGIGRYKADTIGGQWTSLKNYLTIIKNSLTVALSGLGSAIIPKEWNILDTTYRGYQGPSAYLDSKASELRFDYEQAIYNDRENKIMELDFSPTPNPSEYAYMGLEDPTDFDYQNGYFYITDQKLNQVIKYASVSSTRETLGNKDWNWNPEGIVVDSDGTLYITDSERDRIVKTKINGEGWEVSYDDDYYDYYTRFSITGEENFYITPSSDDSSLATKVTFQESGLGNYWMELKNNTGQFSYNSNTRKLGNTEIHPDESDRAFGDHSISFNGNSYMELPQKDGLKFKRDNFLIDFWVNFDTVNRDQVIIAQPDCFIIKYDASNDLLIFKLALDADKDQVKVGDEEITASWNPSVGDWHHVSVLRSGQALSPKKTRIFIDGNEEASGTEKNNMVYEGKDDIYIGGGYYDPYYVKDEVVDFFDGNLDEIRIVKGFDVSATDDPKLLEPYFFNNPKGIIVKGNYLYVADTGNDRIVRMRKDFTDWDTFGTLGSGVYEFNEPMDIEYNPVSSQFYISDKGNNRVVSTNMTVLSDKLINENFAPSSWSQELALSSYSDQVPMVYSEQFDEGAGGIFNGNMRFYNRGPHNQALALIGYQEEPPGGGDKYMSTHMEDDLYFPRPNNCDNCYTGGGSVRAVCDNGLGGCNGNVCCNYCGAHPQDRCCAAAETFPVIAFNLTPFIQTRLFSDKIINIRMKARYEGSLSVNLTRSPGSTRIDSEESRNFNVTKTLSASDDTVWHDETVSFAFPPRVSIDDPNDIYLTFNTCGVLDFNFLEVTIGREVEFGGLTIDNGNFYVTDTYNGYVFTDAPGFGGVFGGKNPPENDIPGDDAQEIRFIYPLEIEPTGTGRFYVLDGVSDKDMAVEAGGQKIAHFYGTKQMDDYYVDFKEGGAWFQDDLYTQGINDKFQKYKDMDDGSIENPPTHKVWVSYGLGPAISHCEIHENEQETFNLSNIVGNNTYTLCGSDHTFRTDNYGVSGQWCHHDYSVGTNPTFVELDGFYYGINNGPSVNIDCKQIAENTKDGISTHPGVAPYPVPPSECIPGPTGANPTSGGLWDWYNEYPYCTYWYPDFQRERVCTEWWPNCYAPGDGQAACHNVSCNGGSFSAGCNSGSASRGTCTGDTGSCVTSGTCNSHLRDASGDAWASDLNDCVVVAPNQFDCNPESVDAFECYYTDGCSVATSTCWDSTASPPGPAVCTSASCPGKWHFTEADDCCKSWSWNCSAHCSPEQSDCFEGYAVRTRQDWKTAIITVEEADLNPGTVTTPNPNYCKSIPDTATSFMIHFFNERRPPPYDMEMLIKDSYNDDNMFSLRLNDIDGDGDYQCRYRYLSDYKSAIMNAGELLGGTHGYDTFEAYLNSLDGDDVVITKVELLLQ